ncbi:MAG: 2-dehydropantoate 2-reductase [Deltaproteobacteria bacterium]|nr:2-dehydropantoate 2-reductase [Deltaproteobacteria bacterium]
MTGDRALIVVIVGPGALGCLFAALLSKAGHSVWFLDHDRERACKIADHGVCLLETMPQFQAVRATVNANEIGRADVVLLCVKSYDVGKALEMAAPLLVEGPLLIALQNGLGHHEILRRCAGLSWAVGITSQGAALVEPGVVRHGGSGITTLGFMDKAGIAAHQCLAETAALFAAAGLPATVSADISSAVWDKLLVNVGINALTALYDCANGELLEKRRAREQLRQAVREAARVARARGVNISGDPVARTEAVCRATNKNISSMLQDIRHGRPTEIEAINGVIVREAAALGMDVPVNQELTQKIRAIQAGGSVNRNRSVP